MKVPASSPSLILARRIGTDQSSCIVQKHERNITFNVIPKDLYFLVYFYSPALDDDFFDDREISIDVDDPLEWFAFSKVGSI